MGKFEWDGRVFATTLNNMERINGNLIRLAGLLDEAKHTHTTSATARRRARREAVQVVESNQLAGVPGHESCSCDYCVDIIVQRVMTGGF